LQAAWDELVLVRAQLTFWAHHPGQERAARDRQVRQLHQRKEELERQIGKLLPERSRRKELDKLGPTNLLKRLPARAAFIDLIRYDHFHKGQRDQPRYVAFVLPSKGEVRRVELGSAAPIDLAVDLWRQAVSGWSPTLKPRDQRDLEDKAAEQAAAL